MNAAPVQALSQLTEDLAYAGRVLCAIERVAEATTPAEALDCLNLAKTSMGVEQAVFASFIRGEDSHENYRFLLAADPRWCFEYQANAWYGSDPWLLYASVHTEPTCASRIHALTAQQREIQALAEKYGMVSVCIAPAASPGSNARVGMLALGSSREGFFENASFGLFKMLARALALELHGWCNGYERGELLRNLKITDDDLQLLRLEAKGARTKQAAAEIGASRVTIDSRWQRLIHKLGSPNRQVAARLALRYGLI